MNATRTATSSLPTAPTRLPATNMRMKPRAPVADWDREQVFDVVRTVIAEDDAYRLCCNSDQVMRVCNEVENLDLELCSVREELDIAKILVNSQQTELSDLRDQLAALRALHVERGVELAQLRGERITAALERTTVAVTGMSTAELTARLNEQIRSHRCADFDLSDTDDTVVIDVESMDVDTKAGAL